MTVGFWGQGKVEALNGIIQSFREYLYMTTMVLGVEDREVKKDNHMGHPSGNSEKICRGITGRERAETVQCAMCAKVAHICGGGELKETRVICKALHNYGMSPALDTPSAISQPPNTQP